MLIATFVAITMMGWWFPGRTMLTVLPLLVLPVVMLVAKTPLWGRVVVALLGAMTLATTYGLAMAGRSREITIAVDPFDMTFPAFQGLAGLFPLYTWWTVETWWLTYFWLALATTYGLAVAGRAEEITIAVDPFDIAYPLFQGLSGLFPLYTWWTVETWWLTYFWLALAGLVTGAIALDEVKGLCTRFWQSKAFHNFRTVARNEVVAPALALFRSKT
jgi:hypothetical protein